MMGNKKQKEPVEFRIIRGGYKVLKTAVRAEASLKVPRGWIIGGLVVGWLGAKAISPFR